MKLNIKNTEKFISKDKLIKYQKKAQNANNSLQNKDGSGNDFLGWINLPFEVDEALISDIENTAKELQSKADFMVTVGSGGSYLGAKAVIEALSDNFSNFKDRDNIKMLFAGNNLSEDYLYELVDLLKDKSWAMTIISKSGTTTEPAVAFRILKNEL
ncbi:MAG: glucose-6-phosphate isomerase, partial [Bacteroidales bacterium]|nr:glucose-6-phosphate isomerase [Bacteroidales bacterium]